eukprot:TRINITY_DN8709_c0_g1_i1.p1 TRINITY_DN8709_c0_g1~~TRINITY_DN8709_c0_g1_i1.p1  ORF type:complete len:655 (+),score=155.84 TRINITY_DN8709_c0_g1_i1:32-1996(+)
MASSRGKKANQSSPKSPVRGTWSPEEDQSLTKAVEQYGAKNWKKIAELVPGRSDVQCLHRWQKVLNPALIKGPWTDEEDEKVKELVATYGPKKWSLIASFLPGRIGKQCRERWANHLDPGVKKGDWQPWEDEMIVKLQRVHGNKWAKMTKDLPGRTDNAIKNRFNSTISRRLKQEKVQTPKKRTAQKIAPSKRAPASPPAYESVSSGGISKRYPSRSTNKLRQAVFNKSLTLEEEMYSSSPPSTPSSPLSLSSLQSYTSEDDYDDNFINNSDSEQSLDNTISSDADCEENAETNFPASPLSVLKGNFTELVEMCANDIGGSESAPKIVLCQETPEGTRVFDTAEVVGAAALSAVMELSPRASPAKPFFENENLHANHQQNFQEKPRDHFYDNGYRSPSMGSPMGLLLSPYDTSFGARPKRSTCNYNRYNKSPTATEPRARTALSPIEKPKSPFKPVSPLLSPGDYQSFAASPRQTRYQHQFIPPTTTKSTTKTKRRLELADEEDPVNTSPTKRYHADTENYVTQSSVNIPRPTAVPLVKVNHVIKDIENAAINEAVPRLATTQNNHVMPMAVRSAVPHYPPAGVHSPLSLALAPAQLVSLEESSLSSTSVRALPSLASMTSGESVEPSLNQSDGGFAALALYSLHTGNNHTVEV